MPHAYHSVAYKPGSGEAEKEMISLSARHGIANRTRRTDRAPSLTTTRREVSFRERRCVCDVFVSLKSTKWAKELSNETFNDYSVTRGGCACGNPSWFERCGRGCRNGGRKPRKLKRLGNRELRRECQSNNQPECWGGVRAWPCIAAIGQRQRKPVCFKPRRAMAMPHWATIYWQALHCRPLRRSNTRHIAPKTTGSSSLTWP